MKRMILFLFCFIVQSVSAGESAFLVVINPSNPVNSIDQKYLAAIYLKKATFWPDMKNILVVDRNFESPVRRQVSAAILERPVSAVRNYWPQIIFSGRDVPPPELKSDQAVVSFVWNHENAIGYVSNGADLHGLKVLKIR